MGRRRTGIGTVYALAHPETGEIRYVGKTIAVPRDRLKTHMRAAYGRMAHTRLSRWLRTLPSEPQLLTLEECSEADAGTAERRWISELREQGARLTNLTDGGEGIPGFRLSREHREKIAAAATGRRHTPETKAKISATKLAQSPGRTLRYRPIGAAGRNREASERMKRMWAERREAMLAASARGLAAARETSHSPDASAKRAESMRRIWAQPGERERRGAVISAARRAA